MSKTLDGCSTSSEDDLSSSPSPKLVPDKQMNNATPKIIRTINGTELNANNIILLRSTKTIDGGHILLRTENFVKNNILIDDGGESKIGQIILQPNSEIKKGVYLQGVKRLGTSAPIFLLSSGESNGHLILHTTSEQVPVSQRQERADNAQPLLKEASSSLEIVHEAEAGCSSGNRPSLLGSDGEPIKLPENLESLPRADHFPTQRHRWNTNESLRGITSSISGFVQLGPY